MIVAPLPPQFEEAVARLIHRSLVSWYESHLGQGARFGDRYEPFLLFPQVYEALDPGEALVAFESSEQRPEELIGVCFVHERETHFALGIVATDPLKAGSGAARRMVEAALNRAKEKGKPVRLVSSLMNLDSFSLYTRMGFLPGRIFQDLAISVPSDGLEGPEPKGTAGVRLARADEAPRIADFEFQLQGIRREKDYAFFLENRVGRWRVWVREDESGRMLGVLVSSDHPEWGMLGPGVGRDAETMFGLIWRALQSTRGQTRVVLVPASEGDLVARLYALGARNVELHVLQTFGSQVEASGIPIPTFLPESA